MKQTYERKRYQINENKIQQIKRKTCERKKQMNERYNMNEKTYKQHMNE